ncbi:hypothetical protein [Pseudomonas sp. BIGb0164]|uniref:hypothetical protein n=1 Tax=Pseudomonas sp. BIGb0164 TaxID=2940605 RepID=UPI002167B819|nr:hypothetical protein [Pseudomonas sp. BIGb0164]MCS4251019.1 hypothetical protein [Pseudomonas sp. BIGb0164]
MAGTVLYKKGPHWTRYSGITNGPDNGYRKFIRAAHHLTKYQISESNLMQLVRAIAWARHHHLLATTRTLPKPVDSERQLASMLKLDDARLEKALEDCDAATRAAIAEAENALPDIKWMTTDSEIDTLTIQTPAFENVRDAIHLALSNTKKQKNQRGRKAKPYQLDLSRACLKVWQEHCEPKTAKRLDFCREAFDAAGMPLGDKSLEALLSEAKRGRIK